MPAGRVCAHPGCPTITTGTRCTAHTRERDRARGRRQARNYGAEHDRARAAWQRRLDAGERVMCWRATRPDVARYPCQTPSVPIPARGWHLGHADDDPSVTMGPEHAADNLAAQGALR